MSASPAIAACIEVADAIERNAFMAGTNLQSSLVAILRSAVKKEKASWVPCCCGNFWCQIHQKHVHDCECPIEEWKESPY